MDIIGVLQKEVNKIAKQKEYKENYNAKFKVSVLQEYSDEKGSNPSHKIILTVYRGGLSHSRVLFPKTFNTYGYDSLEDEMMYLFNSTM